MTVSTDGLQEVAVGRNTRYFSKNGKQIAVTELISIDLSTLPLLDDITRVEVNNDNIVRLLSIVTVKGHFAGYRMKRLYQLGCYSPVSSMKGEVKEMLLAFIQETVEYLHQTAHIYHCDIRLSNIMVNGQGQLKLIDFDIAQTDVFATPDAGVPEAQFFLSVSRRLDHLDISMSLEPHIHRVLQLFIPFRKAHFQRENWILIVVFIPEEEVWVNVL